MRPKRYDPDHTPVQDIIDNLVYVMNTIYEKEQNATHGIAFIANMDGWTMRNFSVEYCHKFMQVLQGTVIPTRVTHFLIVNPPKWFGKVYAIMKKMLSPEFRRKVHMIPVRKLEKFLQPGYEDYLPSELAGGRAITSDLVEDFCDYRQYIESKQPRPLVGGRSLQSNKSLQVHSEHTTTRPSDDETTESGSSLDLSRGDRQARPMSERQLVRSCALNSRFSN
jgi:CRAL/TRIO domain